MAGRPKNSTKVFMVGMPSKGNNPERAAPQPIRTSAKNGTNSKSRSVMPGLSPERCPDLRLPQAICLDQRPKRHPNRPASTRAYTPTSVKSFLPAFFHKKCSKASTATA
jgi:hypothetical protein